MGTTSIYYSFKIMKDVHKIFFCFFLWVWRNYNFKNILQKGLILGGGGGEEEEIPVPQSICIYIPG